MCDHEENFRFSKTWIVDRKSSSRDELRAVPCPTTNKQIIRRRKIIELRNTKYEKCQREFLVKNFEKSIKMWVEEMLKIFNIFFFDFFLHKKVSTRESSGKEIYGKKKERSKRKEKTGFLESLRKSILISLVLLFPYNVRVIVVVNLSLLYGAYSEAEKKMLKLYNSAVKFKRLKEYSRFMIEWRKMRFDR